jgi:hypothetical protein
MAIENIKRHLSIALLTFNTAFWHCIASKIKTAADSACNRGAKHVESTFIKKPHHTPE